MIRLTGAGNGDPIYLNPPHIVSITVVSGTTTIDTTGEHSWIVTETPELVVSLIEGTAE